MTDIVVSLPDSRGGYVHLGEKAEAFRYEKAPYWETGRKPVCLNIGDKVFIKASGKVQGYFIVDDLYWEGDLTDEEAKEYGANYILSFKPTSYRPIMPVSMGLVRWIKKRDFDYIDLFELLKYDDQDLQEDWYNYYQFSLIYNFTQDAGKLDVSKWFG